MSSCPSEASLSIALSSLACNHLHCQLPSISGLPRTACSLAPCERRAPRRLHQHGHEALCSNTSHHSLFSLAWRSHHVASCASLSNCARCDRMPIILSYRE